MRLLLAMLVLLACACPPKSSDDRDKAWCLKEGERYYKEIGSYPSLSDGRDADKVIVEKCERSSNMAFGAPPE